MTSAKKTSVSQPMFGDDRSLEERQIKRARLHFDQRVGQKNRRDDGRERELENQFDPAADSIRFLLGDLQIIIHKPKRPRDKPC